MKLLLADDHGLFRDSMGLWLQQLSDKVEIEFAIDLPSTKAALEQSNFDLIILDLYMPQMQGVSSIQELCQNLATPVVIVSAEENPQVMHRCIDAGAKGYVPKSSDGMSILSALKAVIAGGIYLPSCAALNTEPLSVELKLNDQQIKILSLISIGKSNKEIAAKLFLSEGTIKQYVTKLLRVLKVDNRVQASVKARELLAIKPLS
ncbi:MAG: hypothetical protein OFPII_16000 [Osedax symbiont Rs1]|nr:MAG: hypothetical protein OFPII_16000 [Osedax symbiont Rs1]